VDHLIKIQNHVVTTAVYGSL